MIENNAKLCAFADIEYGPVSGEIKRTIDYKRILHITKRILLGTLKLSLFIFVLIFIVAPLVFKYSYSIQQSVIFLNFVNLPRNPKFNEPATYIEGSHNFYVKTDERISLGVWQVLPQSLLNQSENGSVNYTENDFFSALNDGTPVIIYNHGNSGHRAAGHRVELYKVLRQHFHVIAFDYRSYGDSSNVRPTERGIVQDCIYMYNWVKNRTNGHIFVWGHSLGTGLSTHMLADLSKDNIRPTGLVLESPFNNMKDEIGRHPLSTLFKDLPWFHYTVIEPMQENNFTFQSDKFILKVDCPILILHAEDDLVVPYELGYKLYQTAVEFRRKDQGFVRLKTFDRKFKYGHKYICRAPGLDVIIADFKDAAIKESQEKHLIEQ